MAKLVHEIKVNSDADNVWDVIADLGELDMWSPSLIHDENQLSRYGNPEIGGHHNLPGIEETKVRIVEWETGRRIGYAITGVEGIRSLRNNFSIRPEGDDTTVTCTLNFEVNESEADVVDVKKDFDIYMAESLACLKHYAM